MHASREASFAETKPGAGLTRRELEVVRLIADGLSCREAAQRLSRSPRTVENHLRSVYQKLHVRNRVELMHSAEQLGIVGSPDRSAMMLPPGASDLKSHALELIQEIDRRLAQHANHFYFGELALALSEGFGTRWAGITEISTHDDLLDIIAIAADGERGEFMQCPRHASPCGIAIQEGECAVWEGLAERFPDDQTIVELGATAYVGVLLEDRLMGPVGTLWIMDDKPIDRDLLPLQVLRVLAHRTAAELALAKALDRLGDEFHTCHDTAVDVD